MDRKRPNAAYFLFREKKSSGCHESGQSIWSAAAQLPLSKQKRQLRSAPYTHFIWDRQISGIVQRRRRAPYQPGATPQEMETDWIMRAVSPLHGGYIGVYFKSIYGTGLQPLLNVVCLKPGALPQAGMVRAFGPGFGLLRCV
jgi:hypothetical protein